MILDRDCRRALAGRSAGLRILCLLPLILLTAGTGSPKAQTEQDGHGPAAPSWNAASAAQADSLDELVSELRATGNYPEALSTARRLLGLIRSDRTAPAYRLTDAEQSVSTIERALTLPAPDRRDLARADSLAMVLDSLRMVAGDYPAAKDAAETMLALRRRILGEEHVEVAVALGDLAGTLFDTNDQAGSIEAAHQAYELRLKLLGSDHPDVYRDEANLAQFLIDGQEPRRAELLAADAAAKLRLLVPPGDERRITAFNALAGALLKMGEYEEAEPALRAALAEARLSQGSEGLATAQITQSLGALLLRKGDDLGAESLMREALRVLDKIAPEGHPVTTQVLVGLADLLHRRGDDRAAEPLCLRALEMQRRLMGEADRDVAETLNMLSQIQAAKGDPENAIASESSALAIWMQLYGDKHRMIAAGMTNLAEAYLRNRQYDRADSLLRSSLAVNREVLGEMHPYTARTLSALGSLALRQNRWARADSFLTLAAAAYEGARLRVGHGIERSEFQQSPYLLLAVAKLKLGRGDEAWPAVERDLGRALADLLRASGEQHLTKRESALRDSLNQNLDKLEGKLAAYRRAAKSDSSAETRRRVEAAQTALLNLQARWGEFQEEVARAHPVSEGQSFSLERVQHAVKPDAAIVGWLDDDAGQKGESCWGYVLRSSGPVRWTALAGLPGETRSRVRSFARSLADGNSSPTAIERDARDLYKERIEPLAPELREVTDLIVIPTGVMADVPVEALRDSTGAYLSDRFRVCYTPSSTVYAMLREKSHPASSGAVSAAGSSDGSADGSAVPAHSLFLGDPLFTTAPPLVGKQEAPAAPFSLAEMDSTEFRSLTGGDEQALAALPSLPGTRQEVKILSSLAPDPTVLLGKDASEQEMVRLARTGELARFGVIHLATHALVDLVSPENSCLVLSRVGLPDPLAAAEKGDRIYDGLLSAKEILREWKLNADLVVLSACATAQGKQVRGEGTVGFSHAFFQTGARSLLVSLWRVEDQATALFMQRFYEDWWGKYTETRGARGNGSVTGGRSPSKRMNKVEALQEARRWLREYQDPKGQKLYMHPLFWSGFILIGNGE